METRKQIKVDLYGEPIYYKVIAKQKDRATRFVEVIITENDEVFAIPTGVVAIANIQKPDRHFCYNQCEIENGKIIVELTNQALAAAGTAFCDIELRSTDGEEILSTAAFSIDIERSMRDEVAILSSNEMTAIDIRIQGFINDMLATGAELTDTKNAFDIWAEAAAAAEILREENLNEAITDLVQRASSGEFDGVSVVGAQLIAEPGEDTPFVYIVGAEITEVIE